jgi:3-isopropylmalate dehydrogenase
MKEADAIEDAVKRVLDSGIRTGDIVSGTITPVGTRQMGDAVLAELAK